MWELTKHHLVAIAVAAGLLVYAGLELGLGEYLWRTGGYIAVCLGLIWFGPALGEYTGRFGAHYIHERTPGILVIGVGWLLLLLTPVVISGAKARMAMGW